MVNFIYPWVRISQCGLIIIKSTVKNTQTACSFTAGMRTLSWVRARSEQSAECFARRMKFYEAKHEDTFKASDSRQSRPLRTVRILMKIKVRFVL